MQSNYDLTEDDIEDFLKHAVTLTLNQGSKTNVDRPKKEGRR
jgi:hypothetical protein